MSLRIKILIGLLCASAIAGGMYYKKNTWKWTIEKEVFEIVNDNDVVILRFPSEDDEETEKNQLIADVLENFEDQNTKVSYQVLPPSQFPKALNYFDVTINERIVLVNVVDDNFVYLTIQGTDHDEVLTSMFQIMQVKE